MSVRVTHRRMSPGGWRNEHIIAVQWISDEDGTGNWSTREQTVEWINGGGYAYVQVQQSRAQVGVVQDNPPYLRTFANGIPDDNLLSLPTF